MQHFRPTVSTQFCASGTNTKPVQMCLVRVGEQLKVRPQPTPVARPTFTSRKVDRGLLDLWARRVSQVFRDLREFLCHPQDCKANEICREPKARQDRQANGGRQDRKANGVRQDRRANGVRQDCKANPVRQGRRANSARQNCKANPVRQGRKANSARQDCKAHPVRQGRKANSARQGCKANSVRQGRKANSARQGCKANSVRQDRKANRPRKDRHADGICQAKFRQNCKASVREVNTGLSRQERVPSADLKISKPAH